MKSKQRSNTNKKILETEREFNANEDKTNDEIETMLAYGSTNLGLNNVKDENYLDKRIKEDLGLL